MAQDRQDALPSGSLLHHVYRIERVLGAGTFGITYLAEHIHLNSLCAVKEYLPAAAALRGKDGRSVSARGGSERPVFEAGLRGFFDEAKLLHGMKHPNIVEVNNLFEENGTAYFVMPYLGRQTLWDWIAANPRPDARDLAGIFLPLLEGLKYIHAQNLLHRDIKPANILLAADGRPILIDFGSARYALSSRSQHLTTLLTPGFAPIEQYGSDGRFAPSLDIYSLSGCLYQAMTGDLPQQAPARLEHDRQPKLAADAEYRRRYPENWLRAVDKGLSVHARDRFQSAAEMQAALSGGAAATVKPPPAPKTVLAPAMPPRTATPPPRRQPEPSAAPSKGGGGCVSGCLGGLLKLLVLGGALAAGGYYFWTHRAEISGSLKKTAPGGGSSQSESGYGRLEWSWSGGKTAVYQGRIVDGKANDSSGKAILSISDGTECVGSFADNKRNGEVRCSYPKGSVYHGAWKNDRKSGWGRYSYRTADGEHVYEGGFANDKLSGKGKLSYPNGAVFEGEFAADGIKNKGRGAITGMDVAALAKKHGLKMAAVPCKGVFGRSSADCAYTDGKVEIRYRGKHKNGLWQDDNAVLSVWENGEETLRYTGAFAKGKPLGDDWQQPAADSRDDAAADGSEAAQ